jgi:hypothetical protein
MRERYYSSLVCTFREAINFFEVKVDVKKGLLRSRENIGNRCVSFIEFTFLSIVIIWSWSSMVIMYVLVKVCIWVLGF